MAEHSFFALLWRMKYIDRWSLMRNTQRENVSEHSLDVAILAHALCAIGNTYFGKKLDAGRAAALALFHDCTEIFTGDMPTPVKYTDDEMKAVYKRIEQAAGDRLLATLPPELREVYEPLIKPAPGDGELRAFVRAADKLAAYLKCVEEEKAGNNEFCDAKRQSMELLCAMGMPEVDMFLQRFAGSFAKTVDAQNG